MPIRRCHLRRETTPTGVNAIDHAVNHDGWEDNRSIDNRNDVRDETNDNN